MSFTRTKGYKTVNQWLQSKHWKLAGFQKEAIDAFLNGLSGLVNAPTGSGKTYSLWLPILIEYINNTKYYKSKSVKGLQILWITPLRALAKDLQRNMQLACDEMQIPWQVGIRTGDIAAKERNRQRKQMPQCLI